MSVLYQIAGFGRWMACKAVRGKRVARSVALEQLAVCGGCDSAECRDVAGCLVLSCGPLGANRTGEEKPTCGCGVGWVSPLRRALLGRRRLATKAGILKAMRPAGKSRCRARCDQGKW